MKIVTLAALAGMLVFAPTLYAQQQEQQQQEPETMSVPVRANDLSIELPATYKKMWPDRYDEYKGAYTLANGQKLSIRSFGVNMYAYVDNDRWHKIVAVAPNTFVALDRQLKMEINLLDDDNASGWVTMVVPAQQLSSGELVPEKIVSFAMR
jgi:hypothetical protein